MPAKKTIKIAASKLPKFRPGKGLRDTVRLKPKAAIFRRKR